MNITYNLLFGLVLLAVFVSGHDDASLSNEYDRITCGSAIKLQHESTKFRLHSHNINWGSGSGQQSVTAFEGAGDSNSLWLVRDGLNQLACPSGTPVRCGQIIRFMHVSTRKYLHSHLHAAPLTGQQEVSGFGDQQGGSSDTGDNWKVECAAGGEEYWPRNGRVAIQHVDTGAYLRTARTSAFDNNNCRGCPILGQLEVSAGRSKDANIYWGIEDGVFVADRTASPSDSDDQHSHSHNHSHDEDDDDDHYHDDL